MTLAATYGMSGRTAGIRLGYDGAEAKTKGEELLNNFFTGFGGVKKAIDDSQKFLKENGYVEDFVGRRRRLSDINLPAYEVFLKDASANSIFNPFIICKNRTIEDPKVLKWRKAIEDKIASSQKFQREKAYKEGKVWTPNNEMSNMQYEKLAKEALADGVIIKANTGRIAQASRQCFNARIQGSAATLTKIAMVDIANDPQMQAWEAKLIIPVHDELLVECPEEYADLVEKRLPEIMINAAKKAGDDVPQSCDPYNVTRWYADTMAATLLDECKKLEAKGKTHDEAFSAVIANHSEIPEQAIRDVLTGKTDEVVF